MKKYFLLGCTATLFAMLVSLSSCEPTVTDPNGNRGGNDSTTVTDTTQTPPIDNPNDPMDKQRPAGMSDQWWDVNKAVMKQFNSTTIIPEPTGEYLCYFADPEPDEIFKSGRFQITISAEETVKEYPDVLLKAGWKTEINDGNTWYTDGKDYLVYTYIAGPGLGYQHIYIQNRHDVY